MLALFVTMCSFLCAAGQDIVVGQAVPSPTCGNGEMPNSAWTSWYNPGTPTSYSVNCVAFTYLCMVTLKTTSTSPLSGYINSLVLGCCDVNGVLQGSSPTWTGTASSLLTRSLPTTGPLAYPGFDGLGFDASGYLGFSVAYNNFNTFLGLGSKPDPDQLCPGSFPFINGFFISLALQPVGTVMSNAWVKCGQMCSSCPAGSFSIAGSSSCTTCPAGTYSTGKASTCTNCPAGTYLSTTGGSSVSACTQCPAGTASGVVGANSVAQCTPCTAGATFSASPGATQCTPCSVFVCLSNKYTVDCTVASDLACGDCTVSAPIPYGANYISLKDPSCKWTCNQGLVPTPANNPTSCCSNCGTGQYAAGCSFAASGSCSTCSNG